MSHPIPEPVRSTLGLDEFLVLCLAPLEEYLDLRFHQLGAEAPYSLEHALVQTTSVRLRRLSDTVSRDLGRLVLTSPTDALDGDLRAELRPGEVAHA